MKLLLSNIIQLKISILEPSKEEKTDIGTHSCRHCGCYPSTYISPKIKQLTVLVINTIKVSYSSNISIGLFLKVKYL
jgi:hypothetical protein